MRKIFMLIITLLTSISILAWEMKIHNYSDGDLKGTIYYTFSGACSADDFQVKKGSTYKKNTKSCCYDYIDITSTNGRSKGKNVKFSPKPIKTCGNSTFAVYSPLNNTLVAGEISNTGYTAEVKNSTDGEVIVTFVYSGAANDKHLIQTGRTIKHSTNIYCLIRIEVEATSGISKGLSSQINAEWTGSGISCRSNKFEILNNKDKTMLIEKRN